MKQLNVNIEHSCNAAGVANSATLFLNSNKILFKGHLQRIFISFLVLYASEKSSRNHYVENHLRKFQLVHKLQRCFSSHYLFSCKESPPLVKSMI